MISSIHVLHLISVSSFLNCFALFKMRLLILLLSYESSLYVLDIPVFYLVCILQILSPSLWLLFIFKEQKIILMKSSLSVFVFYGLCYISHQRIFCLIQSCNDFALFSSRSFIILGFTFKPVVHVELNFVCDVVYGLVEILLFACGYSIVLIPFGENFSFLHWVTRHPCQKSFDHVDLNHWFIVVL